MVWNKLVDILTESDRSCDELTELGVIASASPCVCARERACVCTHTVRSFLFTLSLLTEASYHGERRFSSCTQSRGLGRFT